MAKSVEDLVLAPTPQGFQNFLWLLWNHLGLPPPTPVQYDIAAFLADQTYKQRMVKAFRGVGKSWITTAYVLWRLMLDPEERILVLSASKDKAVEFCTFTRRIIDEWSFVARLRPNQPYHRDSVQQFDVGGSRAHQAPSVKARGITGQITGSRSTLIVPDDVETPENSLSPMMRERVSEKTKELDGAILVPGGEIAWLGTDQTEETLYKRLPERGVVVRIWPARVPTPDKVAGYGDMLAPMVGDLIGAGVPAWHPVDPERFDEMDLRQREAVYGRSGFAMQFMMDPSVGDSERYPLKLSDFLVFPMDRKEAPTQLIWAAGKQTRQDIEPVGLKSDFWYGPMNTPDQFLPYAGTVMYVDPSGRGGDETAYAIVSMLFGRLFLRASGGFTEGYTEKVLEALAHKAKEFDVNNTIVEPNYGDGMFKALWLPVVKRIYPHAVDDAEWSKGQKELRIVDTLEPVLNQHRLVVCPSVIEADRRNLPRDVEQSKKQTYMLFWQLTRLTRERGCLPHDDRLEALAGAVAHWLAQMSADDRDMWERHKQAQLDKELRDYLDHALDLRGRPPGRHMQALRGPIQQRQRREPSRRGGVLCAARRRR